MKANGFGLQSVMPIILVLYLVLGGMLSISGAMLYLRKKPDVSVALVFAVLIFSLYIFNRFSDRREDFVNDIGGYVFYRKHTAIFSLSIIICVGLVAWLVATMRFHLYYFVLIATGVMYSFRLIPWYRPGRGLVFYRLKNIPLMKNFVVAFLWGSAVFVIPLLFTGKGMAVGLSLYLLMAALTLSTFSNTLFSDIQDEEGDRLAGTKTLPILIGAPRCYLIIALANLVWIALCTYLLAGHSLALNHFIFFVALAVYPAVYILTYIFNAVPRYAVELISESDLILFALGLALLSGR